MADQTILRLQLMQECAKVLRGIEKGMQSPSITDDEISRFADLLQGVVYGMKTFTLAGVSTEDATRRLMGR